MARKTYHKARRDNPGDSLLEERKDFLRVVLEERASYWQGRIDGFRSDKELHEIVQWHKLGPAINSPPLVLDGRVIANATKKASILKQALLERRDSNEDLGTDPLTIPSAPQRQLP